jgi:hypothetical protein
MAVAGNKRVTVRYDVPAELMVLGSFGLSLLENVPCPFLIDSGCRGMPLEILEVRIEL